MSIKINRFEIKPISHTATVKIENTNTILIKDHETDKVISFIQLSDKKKNKELADRIILTIEDWILEQDNATENQD